ncbi:MAG TPA: 2-hydroxychromene-2-carboxylate isomerase [Candidatus Polarisedimenticolaceae bacterium]|nr:2-hydroxychromene-2-carboxylate isomerase [Candidatus Polarisedimenticolaceae bacterium]
MTCRAVVPFYFDFISPYSWLALMQAEAFAERHGIRWQPRPVVYAALLQAHGLIGPVETPAKRRYTFRDVERCAAAIGVRLSGPPAHPFRSLEALRVQYLFREESLALRLAASLADACWGQGRALTDLEVIREVVAAVGLDADALEQRSASPEIKAGLRAQTDDAVRRGVFGVPTFVLEDELFWGHDRLEPLAARLDGRLPPPGPRSRELLERPRGVERKRC